ncbi:MAG: AarF/ABC1/UbiB kinase family protein [Flavobacteriales bacterium]|nr:AarF/ABC1/UbiB kinase family protein [Flavobacteriales bacterium]
MGLVKFFIKQVRHANRYNKIIRVLLKYGFEDYVAHFKDGKGFLRYFIPKRKIREAAELNKWERMRLVCEELGPTFVKFGQVLSSRRDLLPAELIEELSKLQDSVPIFPGKIAKEILDDEFGAFKNEKIISFDEFPFASASMAQVHKARLATGEQVAIKVQRPDIRDMIEEDIEIMRGLAGILGERLPSIKHFDPVGLVDKFSESIHFELDFIHESINLKRFAYNFKDSSVIKAPQIYNELTSTKVLTMEFVEGQKPKKVKLDEGEQPRSSKVAREIADSFFKQVFDHGFFHADPHAGNIIVNEKNEIYFIDFGMMGTILKKDKEHLGNLLLSIEMQDVKLMMTAISYLTNVVVFENRKSLEYELIEYINKYAYTENFHLQVGQMLTDLTEVMNNHNLQIPSHFFLITRAMFALEGLVRDLDNEIVLMDLIKPVVRARLLDDRNPVTTGEKIINSMYDLGNYLEEFPSDLRQTMKLIRKGKLSVNLKHEGMDPTVKTLNRLGRQLIIVILVSSIILGSSVFILADTDPKLWGVPVYSLVGYLFASFMGVYLLLRLYKQESED